MRCDFPRANEYVGSFLELARQAGDATSVAQGVRISALIATASGELVVARERFLEVIEAFEREGTATTLGDYLTIPRPMTLAQYSFAAQQLGLLDEADELCARSLRETRESGHHLTSCYAMSVCAMKAMVGQDPATVFSITCQRRVAGSMLRGPHWLSARPRATMAEPIVIDHAPVCGDPNACLCAMRQTRVRRFGSAVVI